jgi:hypothetical protein
MRLTSALAALLALLLTPAACGDADTTVRSVVAFDLSADLAQPASFWQLPFPSDLRLRADGTPDLTGYPVKQGAELFENLRDAAQARPGWPVMPVAYFRFSRPLAPRALTDVIPAAADAPVLLVDVDPGSPERGKLVPTVAATLGNDDWSPDFLLAIAPRPGFVLVGGRRYAVVVRRGLGDAEGHDLGVPSALAALAAGKTPEGTRAAAAVELYAPLFATLAQPGLAVPAGDVAAATVFTTGDVVADTAAMSNGLLARDHAQIGALTLDPDDGVHPGYCELLTTVALPQYLTGDEPYDSGGRFQLGDDGLPVLQKTISVPAVVTVPRTLMPAAGYPLALYFHGSGGLASQVVDRGPVLVAGGPETPGEGPAFVLAGHGFAAASSALPVNPERVPGASDIAYLNFANLGAFPNLFREGVIEQRLFLDQLATLTIAPDLLAGCDGAALPAGQTAFHFDAGNLYGMGQSMGGMYTNLVGAVEPRLRALVPTGAGGFWSFMVLESSLYADVAALLPPLLGTNQPLSFMHPGLALLELAFEPAEPFVYMPRLSRRPLPGYPARPVYEPVGAGDTYFSAAIYDAVALAYGHEQAGEVLWPSMQDALALEDRAGVLAYPVEDNLVSASGDPYTGVVVQYAGDGIYDAHAIFAQLPAVKFQYGCFFETMAKTGVASVLAPGLPGTPCLRP